MGRDRRRRHDDGRRPGRLRGAGRRRAGEGVLRPQGGQGARPAATHRGPTAGRPSDRCLVVEDVVTTGGSTLAAIEALQEAGLRDLRRASACSTGSPAAARAIEARGRRALSSPSRRSTTSTPSAPTGRASDRLGGDGRMRSERAQQGAPMIRAAAPEDVSLLLRCSQSWPSTRSWPTCSRRHPSACSVRCSAIAPRRAR